MVKVLDSQKEKAEKLKEEHEAAKRAEGLKLQQDFQQYENEQEQKKREKLEKNRKHQVEVTRQIEDRKKMLSYIGASVITN